MGYDGSNFNMPADFSSLFFVDFAPCPSGLDFHQEFSKTLERLVEKYGDIAVFHNGRTAAQYLIKSCTDNGVKFNIQEPFEISAKTSEIVRKRLAAYQLYDSVSLYWACLAEEIALPLIIPHLEIRILNAHFSRQKKSVNDFNYFVHIFNERFYLLMRYFADHKKIVISQLLMSTPALFRSFFDSEQMRNWLAQKKTSTPHNYEAEILLLSSLGLSLTKKANQWPQLTIDKEGSRTYQQSAAPLHRLYKKNFNQSANFNAEVESLYGSVT